MAQSGEGWKSAGNFNPGKATGRLTDTVIQMEHFLMAEKDRMIHALNLFSGSVPHFGDACLCAAALDISEGRILSFDKKLKNVSGIVCKG